MGRKLRLYIFASEGKGKIKLIFPIFFQVAQLESLAIYMNCDTRMFSEYSSDNYLKMFQETIASKTTKPSDYDFSKSYLNIENR